MTNCKTCYGCGPKVIEGLEMLSKAGLRYPIPTYGIQMDPSEGLSYSYPQGERK